MLKWSLKRLSKIALIFIVLGSPLSSCSPAQEAQFVEEPRVVNASQARGAEETFEDAMSRYRERRRARLQRQGEDSASDEQSTDEQIIDEPLELAGALEDVDVELIPRITKEQMNAAFKASRDTRYLFSTGQPDFARRPSWLFPDDGCFSRTALTNEKLSSLGFPSAAKVFLFGNLRAKTPHSPAGEVYWWYHVANVYRVMSGQSSAVWVIDPGLSEQEPLPLLQWAQMQSDDLESLKFSVCHPRSYEPGDPCLEPSGGEVSRAATDEAFFLDQEWSRQLELGRDPQAVLGEFPPWDVPLRPSANLRSARLATRIP